MSISISRFITAVSQLVVGENVQAFGILWDSMTDQERIEAVKDNAGDLRDELAMELNNYD